MIRYLRTGSGAHIRNAGLADDYVRAVREGGYVGFYHELRGEEVRPQIRFFLRQCMGKRADLLPALEVGRVLTDTELILRALAELERQTHGRAALCLKTARKLDSALYGYPVFLLNGRNAEESFLLDGAERLILREDAV